MGERRWLRRLLVAGAVLIGGAVGFVGLVLALTAEPAGARATGARLERMKQSPQWGGAAFTNPWPRVDGPPGQMVQRWITGGSEFAEPAGPLPVQALTSAAFDAAPADGLRVTWLGHSTMIVEIDGSRVLIDPVWGDRASPVSFAGPARWYAPPLPLSDLPRIDAIVLSHDHYDHLDVLTVKALADRDLEWVVPLGIGAHLESWGVPSDRITELDWWDEARVGDLRLTCTPARHFSGRAATLADQNATLWAGWALTGPAHRVFYSGDTAMHDAFVRIGEQLGPFDLTLIESGAYNQMWADVHLGPEQAVWAHQLVRGELMMPVHWGMFDLAMHGWTEPVERVLAAADRAGVSVALPRPGGMVEPGVTVPGERWWPEVPWEPADQAPVFSSEVASIQGYPGD
jgi:L-ascorbate metabolism protein UlaG (beta-lactamase superfamily)